MPSRLRTVAWILLAVSVACAVPQSLARKKEKSPEASATEQKRAVHALNRLAFGPRPGEVQQVLAMGVDNWIDLQLHPEKISVAAAAAASGDASGNAPNNLADPNAEISANSMAASPEPAAALSGNNMRATDMAAPVTSKPTPEVAAEARAREDRLYTGLKVQSL